MAEFIKNEEQLVQPNQAVLLNSSFHIWSQWLFHQNESGTITLRGIVNNPYKNLALYQVTFNGNIAIPEGGTASPISVAIARGGEPLQSSKAIVTPAEAEEYFNVTSTAFIVVPRGMQADISVENVSEIDINVQNANLVVQRIA